MNLHRSLVLSLVFLLLAQADAQETEGPIYPLSIATRGDETFIADRKLPGIWIAKGSAFQEFYRASKQLRSPLNAVRCLAVDQEGNLLAGDSATRDVYRFVQGKPVPLAAGGVGIPMSIAVLKSGDILVADLELHRIVRISSEGGMPETFLEVQAPRGLFVDAEEQVWIVSHGKNQLLRIGANKELETIVSGRAFQFPSAVVVNREGTAFVCDTYAKAVWKVAPGEAPVKWFEGEPLVSPVGLTWRGDEMLVADPRAGGLVQIDADGKAKLTPYSDGRP